MATRGKTRTIAVIEWDDACIEREPKRVVDFDARHPVVTAGILVKRNRSYLTVCQDDLTDGRYRDAMHIPVGMIRKLRTWRVRSRL